MDILAGVEIQARRARLVTWVLGVAALLALVAVGSGLAQHLMLQRALTEGLGEDEISANDLRQAAIAVAQLVVVLVGAVAWLRWAHRAYANLALMGSRRMDHGTGWVVGCWFVPFVNLFAPFDVTRELWLRSGEGNASESLKGRARPILVVAWWSTWIGQGLLGPFASRSAESLEQLLRLTEVSILQDVLNLGAAAAAIGVVRGIDARQRASAVAAHAVEALS